MIEDLLSGFGANRSDLSNDVPRDRGKVLARAKIALETSYLSEWRKDELRETIEDLETYDLYQLVRYLDQNQLDPIAKGTNYSQTDIKNKLKKEI